MAKKMTIVEMYEVILGKVEGVLSEEEMNFLVERKEMHSKKNSSRKPTKAQEANEGIKAEILEGMVEGKAYTITEMIKSISACSDLTNQRVSALVRQLKEATLVVRTEEKGKAYFTKA